MEEAKGLHTKWGIIVGDYNSDDCDPIRGFFEDKDAALTELVELRWQGIECDLYERYDATIPDELKERLKMKLRERAVSRISQGPKNVNVRIKSLERHIRQMERGLKKEKDITKAVKERVKELIADVRQQLASTRVDLVNAERIHKLMESGVDVLIWNETAWVIKNEYKEINVNFNYYSSYSEGKVLK